MRSHSSPHSLSGLACKLSPAALNCHSPKDWRSRQNSSQRFLRARMCARAPLPFSKNVRPPSKESRTDILSVLVDLIQAWRSEEIFHSSFSISHLPSKNESPLQMLEFS